MTEDRKLGARLHHALNGPTRPNMPQASSFMVEDAEAEIRRSTQRHFAQLAEIERLKTDLDQWRNEALLFKTDNERLQQRLKDLEESNDELRHSIATMEAHMHNSAQSFVQAFNAMRGVKHTKVVTPPALAQLQLVDKPADDDDTRGN